MFQIKKRLGLVIITSVLVILGFGQAIQAQTIKAGSVDTINLQPTVKVTKRPITVFKISKKTGHVIKTFRLPAHSLVKLRTTPRKPHTQLIIRVNQPVTTKTILVTKAKDYVYQNQTTALSVNQQIKMYELGKQWRQSLTTKQKNALIAYTGITYTSINGSLRGQVKSTPKIKQQVKNIDAGLMKFKLPYSFTVWRGTSLANVQASLANKPLKLGAIYRDKGYMSTSLLKSVANNFKSDALLKIQVPTGRQGADLAALSNFKNEDEYLIKHNAKLIVTGISAGIGKKIITLNFSE